MVRVYAFFCFSRLYISHPNKCAPQDLPYETILSCAATCKSFLHDTMPLIKKLHINTSYQMNLTVAARYRDIREIHINSLMVWRPHIHSNCINVDFESSVRMVPFLSRFAHVSILNKQPAVFQGVLFYFTPIT